MNTTIADNSSSVEDIIRGHKVSFGNNLRLRREERNMSPGALAQAVRENLAAQAPALSPEEASVTSEHIEHWEMAFRTMPTEAQYEALAQILIDSNPHIQDKEGARRNFRIAYEISLAAKSENPKYDNSRLYNFARLVSKHRKELGVSCDEVAQRIHVQLSSELSALPEAERTLLKSDDKDVLIACIEAGKIQPSKPLMLAMGHVLNTTRSMREGECEEFSDTFETMQPVIPEELRDHDTGGELVSLGGNGERNWREKAIATEYKNTLRAFFDDAEGHPMTFKEMAAKTRDNSSATTFSGCLGVGNTQINSLSDNVLTAFIIILEETGKEGRIPEFKKLFDEYRDFMGKQPRQPDRQVRN